MISEVDSLHPQELDHHQPSWLLKKAVGKPGESPDRADVKYDMGKNNEHVHSLKTCHVTRDTYNVKRDIGGNGSYQNHMFLFLATWKRDTRHEIHDTRHLVETQPKIVHWVRYGMTSGPLHAKTDPLLLMLYMYGTTNVLHLFPFGSV